MAGEIKEPQIEGRARSLSGWCGMPHRAIMQHRACPLDFGGSGGYGAWQCECVCHEEDYVEPQGMVSEPTPSYIIERDSDGEKRDKPLTRGVIQQALDQTKHPSGATKVGTHWTTGGTNSHVTRQGLGWTPAPVARTVEEVITKRTRKKAVK